MRHFLCPKGTTQCHVRNTLQPARSRRPIPPILPHRANTSPSGMLPSSLRRSTACPSAIPLTMDRGTASPTSSPGATSQAGSPASSCAHPTARWEAMSQLHQSIRCGAFAMMRFPRRWASTSIAASIMRHCARIATLNRSASAMCTRGASSWGSAPCRAPTLAAATRTGGSALAATSGAISCRAAQSPRCTAKRARFIARLPMSTVRRWRLRASSKQLQMGQPKQGRAVIPVRNCSVRRYLQLCRPLPRLPNAPRAMEATAALREEHR